MNLLNCFCFRYSYQDMNTHASKNVRNDSRDMGTHASLIVCSELTCQSVHVSYWEMPIPLSVGS